MGKENGGNARDGISGDFEDEGASGGGRRVADTETFEDGAVGEERCYGGCEGLERIIGLVGQVVIGYSMWVARGEKRVENGFG